MTSDAIGADRLTVPAGFEKRVVRLRPHEQLPARDAALREAIIFVAVGELDVICTSGQRHRFVTDDILSLANLEVGAACGAGDTPAQLIVIHRRRSTG
ncbi:MAG: hypothetical protein ACRDV3_04445 [Acidothermaceae bacterium]